MMNCFDEGPDEVEYELVNRAILYINVTNISLIIYKGNLGHIDAYDNSFHGYYIIQFSLSLYTLHEELNIDGQVIYSDEMVFEGTNFLSININYCYYVSSTYY